MMFCKSYSLEGFLEVFIDDSIDDRVSYTGRVAEPQYKIHNSCRQLTMLSAYRCQDVYDEEWTPAHHKRQKYQTQYLQQRTKITTNVMVKVVRKYYIIGILNPIHNYMCCV